MNFDKRLLAIILFCSLVLISLIFLGSLQQSTYQPGVTDLTEFSTNQILQKEPFTAKLKLDEETNSFIISPLYRGSSSNDLVFNVKYEIYNFKIKSWVEIESKIFTLASDGHLDTKLSIYGQGLYNSPTGYLKEGKQEVSDGQKIQWYSCLESISAPDGYVTGGGTVYTSKCLYPGEYINTMDYDEDDMYRSNKYQYVPNYYFFDSDYIKNNEVDIRITYTGDLYTDQLVPNTFPIILIDQSTEDKEKEGLSLLMILVISFSSIIFMLILILVMFYIIKKKN